MESEIKELEEALRKAMLSNDVNKLDELIDDSLVFITPYGNVVTKKMDLETHQNKTQKMSQLTPSEQTVQLYDNLAVVTVKMDIVGTYGTVPISGLYRYIRIWKRINDKWKIVAGSVTSIPV